MRGWGGSGGDAGGGSGGDTSTVRVDFAWNTPSPLLLVNLAAGQVLCDCKVIITTAFDDGDARIEVGTPGTPTLVFAGGEVDVTDAGPTFENPMLFLFPAINSLILTILPAASSRGAGTLILTLKT